MDDDDDRGIGARSRLPMTMGQQTRFGIDLKEAVFGRRKHKCSSPKYRGYGHEMRATEQSVRLEMFEETGHSGSGGKDRPIQYHASGGVRLSEGPLAILLGSREPTLLCNQVK